MTPSTECTSFFPYEPSLVLAAVAIGLFAILSGLHAIRMLATGTYDHIFFILGGLCQMTGYIARAYSTQNVCNRSAYAAQAVLLLVGPTLLMFTITLSHTAYVRALAAHKYAWVPLHLQKPIYFTTNVICFTIQLAGGMGTGVTEHRRVVQICSKLKVAAYVMQIVFWCYVLAENTTVTFRLGRAIEKAAVLPIQSNFSSMPMVLHAKERFPHFKRWSQLFGLAIAIIGFGRNLVRLTEFGVSFLQENEWPSYAFDGYQMAVVMGTFAVWYLPGKLNDVEHAKERYRNLETEAPNAVPEAGTVKRS